MPTAASRTTAGLCHSPGRSVGQPLGGSGSAGFTLTELLISVAIILLLMSLVAGAASAARTSQKASATKSLIDKLDSVLMQQLEKYDSIPVDMRALKTSGTGIVYTTGSFAFTPARAWHIRRNLISADMPDRWTDVEYLYNNSNLYNPALPNPQFPSSGLTAPQRSYLAIWHSLTPPQRITIKAFNSSAECLFMVVMRGGIVDCLDCGQLQLANVGDEDGDGMPEFWDEWKNPIGYLLWPPALELPAGSGTRFFSGSRSLTPFLGEDINGNGLPDAGEDINGDGRAGVATPTLGMRPLIYSPGPDGRSGLFRYDENTTLGAGANPVGRNCGNPSEDPASRAGGPDATPSAQNDNITNLDDEAKQ